MEMDSLQLVGVILGAVLVCSAHLGAGFFGGYRVAKQAHPPAKNPDLMPAYVGHVLELVERSQNLHTQLIEEVKDLPVKVMEAAEKLLIAAETVRHETPIEPPTATRCDKILRDAARKHGAVSAGEQGRVQGIPSEHGSLMPDDIRSLAIAETADVPPLESDSDRRPYPMRQFIAFYDGTFPDAERFEPVFCHDISMGGISFHLSRPPDHDLLVISLGIVPELRFLACKVCSYRQAFVRGEKCFRIGCQFIHRLDSDKYHWNEDTGRVESAESTALVAAT